LPKPARSWSRAALAAAWLTAVQTGRSAAVIFLRSSQATFRSEARMRWILCRYRHKIHYPDTVVMPALVLPALVSGGDRAAGIGIITGPAGRPAAGRVAGIVPAVRLAAWCGLGLAA
jgi:hypothetical protein